MEEIAAAARPFFGRAFDGVIRIEATDRGEAFWVDGRSEPPLVTLDAPQGVERGFCLWRAGFDTLRRLFSQRERRLESAFIAGRLKISGDMSVMARLELADG
jgi:hypothetical protein